MQEHSAHAVSSTRCRDLHVHLSFGRCSMTPVYPAHRQIEVHGVDHGRRSLQGSYSCRGPIVQLELEASRWRPRAVCVELEQS